jgi:uncharacterized protein
MNAPLSLQLRAAHALAQAVAQACDRIAPTWPLDRLIAVNPCWGWRGTPVPHMAAAMGVLDGICLTAPRAMLQQAWQTGELGHAHLLAALQRLGLPADAQSVAVRVQQLHRADTVRTRLPLVCDLRDQAEPGRPQPWSSLVVHQISQHCAAFFDRGQASWTGPRDGGLLVSWRRQLLADRGLPWSRGRAAAAAAAALAPAPQDALACIGWTLDRLGLPPAAHLAYLSALLLSVNGWAAWCAHARWQAQLRGQDNSLLLELLAVRLLWEWLLREDAPDCMAPAWLATWSQADAEVAALAQAQQGDWVWQEAWEIAYQRPLARALSLPRPVPPTVAAVAHVVCCIDVRSEPLRRAVEAADPAVLTRGFAGFFGLPIAYTPLGSTVVRPQLPGLLAPQREVTDVPDAQNEADGGAGLGQWLARRRRQAVAWRQRWQDLRSSPSSGFSLVEAVGLGAAASLCRDSLPSTAAAADWTQADLPAAGRRLAPRWPAPADEAATQADVTMLAGILRAMGLTGGFAPLLVLLGHGSQSANNAHAAGLDCGACGGQTGEVNARVLADLLNRPALREGLRLQGIDLPASTWVLAGLHHTTTDDVNLFDTDRVPPACRAALAQLQASLGRATQAVRAERAPSLGLAALTGDAPALTRAVRQRANDWAQVRPEWGLVDNAAFIVAPRDRTRHLNLAGRSFLHDYDWRQDSDFSVLTLIMTAPMVVTHWINWQYHASSVAPQRYGSGNKLLHNVVGQGVGVFEGNGGDLRIGLPWQSVADGQGLRHRARRLSVFIAAPRAALDQVIARHTVVADLVDHGWLHLFALDDGDLPQAAVWRRRPAGGWEAEPC